MDPQKQIEIARKGGQSGGPGRGWRGDSAGHARAGRLGGKTTAAIYGLDFYRKIGGEGGKISPGKFQLGSMRAITAGRKGGKMRIGDLLSR